MRSSLFVSSLVSLSTVTLAWPGSGSPWQDVKGVQGIEPLLYKRQDSSASPSPTPPPKSSSTASASSSSGSDSSNSDSSSASPSGSDSGSDTKSASNSGKSSSGKSSASQTSATSSKTFNPLDGPGGVEMVSPATTATTYFKIGDYVTLAWNYTSLSQAPSAVDVLATCTANNHYYTLTSNMTFSPTNTFLWDTNSYQNHPPDGTSLLTETYTLVIHDAQKDVSATAAAGYLGTFEQYRFGMYTPQPYTPLDQYSCATCKVNGALSSLERQALSVILAMGAITVLSFTWFASGFGLF